MKGFFVGLVTAAPVTAILLYFVLLENKEKPFDASPYDEKITMLESEIIDFEKEIDAGMEENTENLDALKASLEEGF